MKIITYLLLFILLLNLGCYKTSKEDKINSLIELLNTEERISGGVTKLVNSQEGDSIFWDNYKRKFLSGFKDSITPKIAHVYSKYFTEDEINNMYNFYSTEKGKAILAKMDSLLIELMSIGNNYGKNIAAQIAKEENAKIEKENKYKFNNEFKGCSKFKTGKFKYLVNDSIIFYIDRTLKKQIETHGKGKNVFNINWISECKYEIILLETNNPFLSEKIGLKMTFNIYESNDYSYKYAYKLPNDSIVHTGEMFKIEQNRVQQCLYLIWATSYTEPVELFKTPANTRFGY